MLYSTRRLWTAEPLTLMHDKTLGYLHDPSKFLAIWIHSLSSKWASSEPNSRWRTISVFVEGTLTCIWSILLALLKFAIWIIHNYASRCNFHNCANLGWKKQIFEMILSWFGIFVPTLYNTKFWKMIENVKSESYGSPYKVYNSRNFDVLFLENLRDTRFPRPEESR